ncbi:MAG TPA: serine hydrolase domain-containing protein [Gaiellaceae bacterium]|nr:serine hydrolase domain-containing protein [Gaiellaceae bacterium]
MSTAAVDAVVAEIEKQAEEYLSARPEGTLIVGLSVDGERHVRSVRAAGAEHAPLPDEKSIFEIGSVSKVFSTTVLAALEDEGLIGLEDPIRKHLPNGSRLPEHVGSLTIRRLATHSAGFGSVGKLHQKLIDEELRGTEPPWGTYTHYLRYRKEHLYSDLETAELAYPTGEGWLYSVLGMGTLGHILELASGRPYEELLVETVCEPLGLADIRYTLSEEQLGRVVYAYDAQGQPCPNWYHDVMLPQGGLRGTIDDLLTFAEANIRASVERDDSRISKALRRPREVFFSAPESFRLPETGEPLDFVQGLGWRGTERPDGWAWWHGGTTLFYLAGCGVDEHARVGFAVLSSYRASVVDRVALHPLQQEWFRLASDAAAGREPSGVR